MVVSMDRWIGKVAVVTGASSGIGAATAEALVKAGVKVVGLARRKERVEELAKKLQGQKGKLYAVKCDISKEDDTVKSFQWITDNVGPVQILVNNAGIVQNNTLIDGDVSAWKKVFDVNVFGLLVASREATRIMRKNSLPGHIVNINSTLGHRLIFLPGINVYPASKFAVTALTETLSKELLSADVNNIKVTSVSPGMTKSEFGGSIDKAAMTPEIQKLIETYPRLDSEDVADAVIYVLSTRPEVLIEELIIRPPKSP